MEWYLLKKWILKIPLVTIAFSQYRNEKELLCDHLNSWTLEVDK